MGTITDSLIWEREATGSVPARRAPYRGYTDKICVHRRMVSWLARAPRSEMTSSSSVRFSKAGGQDTTEMQLKTDKMP